MENGRYDLAGKVIGLAMEVHTTLGPGFLESVYERALTRELELSSISHQTQVRIPVDYKGIVAGDFIADLVVSEQLIVEIKAVRDLVVAHEVQLVNYLSATGKDVGLLLNFGTPQLQFKKKFRTPATPQRKEQFA